MRGISRKVLSLMLCALLLPASAWAAELKIAVLAKNGPSKALQQWGATAQYLSTKLPEHSFVIVPLSFDEVFPAIEANKVDFFLINSSMFITAKLRYAAEAIATMVNSRQGKPLKSFGGVIFTYITQDGINQLEDLKGKRFMAVKQSSFGGWQMAYKELLDQGINPQADFTSLTFGDRHDNVVYAVQNGEADAGTVRTDTLERMAASGDIDMAEFKILNARQHSGFPFVVSTALYPEWPFAKTAATNAEVAQQVATALFELSATNPAAKAAKVVGWSLPLDYQPVEALQQSLGVGAFQQ
jgi:phosphate/phosphite/phosphonate ABC transporter binding protein